MQAGGTGSKKLVAVGLHRLAKGSWSERSRYRFLDSRAPQISRDYSSIWANEHDLGNCRDAIVLRHRALEPIATQKGLCPANSFGLREFTRRIGFRIGTEADHNEPPVFAKGLIGGSKIWRLGNAGTAPGRPKVKQHELSLVTGQLERSAVQGRCRQFRSRVARLQIHDGSEGRFPRIDCRIGQRRSLPGELQN